jgi:hypothetical protein
MEELSRRHAKDASFYAFLFFKDTKADTESAFGRNLSIL